MQQHLNPRISLDPLGQVPRHVLIQPVLAHHQVDLAHVISKEDRRLPCRVAPSHDHNGIVDADLGLHRSGRVVDAGLFECLQARYRQLPVTGAGGQHHRTGQHVGPIGKTDPVLPVVPGQLLRGDEHAGAGPELPGLDRRTIGQLSAGYPGGESKIVLDPGGRRGLPPDGHRIDRNRAQTLRRAVGGRGQPDRARTDDDQVASRSAAGTVTSPTNWGAR